MEDFITISVDGHRVVNCTELSDNAIMGYLKSIVKTFRLSDSSAEIYAGITGDIADNLSRHHIDEYILCIMVNSFETAARIEQRLHDELNCYIGNTAQGGRGGNEESIYVYLAQRNLPDFTD
jgi:hypothetical protein